MVSYSKKCHKPNFFERSKIKNRILKKEVNLIAKHYSFLEYKITKGVLVCKGVSQPTLYSEKYNFRIIYDGFNAPKIYVDSPQIEYNDDIHMFPKDNSLCLYHKSDLINEKWDYRIYNLYNTIIPWTMEWFVFYELYLISGKWEHPFVEHRS